MEAFPIGVIELVGQKAGGAASGHAAEGIDQRVRANDPEHVEAPQRIH